MPLGQGDPVELRPLDIEHAGDVAADLAHAHRRKLVTPHDTFGYYADRYGFEIIGAPLGTSSEHADPAAGDIAALIEMIQDAGVPAIFVENVINLDVMEQIAEAAGVELAPPLYTDALGDEDSPASTYLAMMEYNTSTIVEALSAEDEASD